jgi:hypothetical protein
MIFPYARKSFPKGNLFNGRDRADGKSLRGSDILLGGGEDLFWQVRMGSSIGPAGGGELGIDSEGLLGD